MYLKDIRVGDFEVVNLYILEVQFEWLISDLQNELDRELQELGLEPEFGISGVSKHIIIINISEYLILLSLCLYN